MIFEAKIPKIKIYKIDGDLCRTKASTKPQKTKYFKKVEGIEMLNKIDLVYLWVDGSDTKWAKKKASALAKINGITLSQDAIDNCRFVQHDELKYSLRSVEKYAPWINHIYIVTDNQVPEWLNTKNKKVTIVDQSLILPKDVKFCFNSTAIEHCIVNIPGLSENFLYACDDMFFWNNTEPDFFFDDKDKAICHFNKPIKNRKYKHMYGSQIINAYKLILEKFGHCTKYFPHHGIDAYKKSSLKKCKDCFKKQMKQTTYSTFRSTFDIQRVIYSYFMIEEETAKPYFHKSSFFKKTEDGYVSLKIKKMKNILKQKYPILCINDGRKTTLEDRKYMVNLLELKFPNKSKFER